MAQEPFIGPVGDPRNKEMAQQVGGYLQQMQRILANRVFVDLPNSDVVTFGMSPDVEWNNFQVRCAPLPSETSSEVEVSLTPLNNPYNPLFTLRINGDMTPPVQFLIHGASDGARTTVSVFDPYAQENPHLRAEARNTLALLDRVLLSEGTHINPKSSHFAERFSTTLSRAEYRLVRGILAEEGIRQLPIHRIFQVDPSNRIYFQVTQPDPARSIEAPVGIATLEMHEGLSYRDIVMYHPLLPDPEEGVTFRWDQETGMVTFMSNLFPNSLARATAVLHSMARDLHIVRRSIAGKSSQFEELFASINDAMYQILETPVMKVSGRTGGADL